jgi:cation:H+ antiporter
MLEVVAGFLLGLAALVAGADRAVKAAGELALAAGVSAFFVGVTVVSIGTSVPEMTTSIYAASYDAGDLLVGNIVGSETAQITLALALVALVSPIVADRRNVAVYGGAMVVSMVIMLLVVEDGRLIRSEGVLMMLSYVFFVHTMYTTDGGAEVAEEVLEPEATVRETVPWVVAGLGLVAVGGHLLVTNGVALASALGVPTFLVGLLTGLGTTTPEIAVAVVAAREGREGISVGAILGSNITDPVFSLGVGGLVADVTIANVAAVNRSATYMLAVSIVVLALLYWRRGLDRPAAVFCLLCYVPSLLLA